MGCLHSTHGSGGWENWILERELDELVGSAWGGGRAAGRGRGPSQGKGFVDRDKITAKEHTHTRGPCCEGILGCSDRSALLLGASAVVSMHHDAVTHFPSVPTALHSPFPTRPPAPPGHHDPPRRAPGHERGETMRINTPSHSPLFSVNLVPSVSVRVVPLHPSVEYIQRALSLFIPLAHLNHSILLATTSLPFSTAPP